MLSKFRQVFRTYPLLSNMTITCALYCTANVAQQTVRRVEQYDWPGTARIMTVAFCGYGPVLFYWYKALDKYVPGKSFRAIILKCALDFFVISPPCLFMFFVGNSILEGQKDILAEFKEKALKTYITGACYWPPAQAINFLLVPPHLRVVYVGCCSFFWGAVVCFIKGQPMPTEEVLEEA
ncbi:mpv17-like protein [Lineus longissimus]|uniref:mpv17-like protein n=1 Tax=Lineus longissimus TaxID=88925 RepID=UPI00315D7E34